MRANNYISVLEKTFRVLESFHGERGVALRDLAARTRLVKSSVYRILFTLERLGYIEKGAGGRYSITLRFDHVGLTQRSSLDLSNLVAPFMASLERRFGETVNFGVLDGGEVLYLRVLESSHAFRMVSHVGLRSPVHSTALGKCLLCRLPRNEVDAILKAYPLRPLTPRTIRDRRAFDRELQRVRVRGYAVDNEEDSPGARCVAAPVMDREGRVRGAISISGPAARVSPKQDMETAEVLIETCGQISKLMDYAATPSSYADAAAR
jgi:DNA-binding IclR family transcriptional regulator